MDRHFFISVSTYKSNRMGEELSSYVENKYHHMVVHKNDFFDIKADIQEKMQKLEEKYMTTMTTMNYDFPEAEGLVVCGIDYAPLEQLWRVTRDKRL